MELYNLKLVLIDVWNFYQGEKMDFNPEIQIIEGDQSELIGRGLRFSTRGISKFISVGCDLCAICNV